MKLIVEVQKGKNLGSRYEITARAYRAIGRSGSRDATLMLNEAGDAELEVGLTRRIDEHLAHRSPPERSAEPLRIGEFRRGRDILIEDEKVSRTHAMIFVDEEGPSIVDLLSTNGTHVNGKRVGDSELAEGDLISIGKTRFVVHLVEDGQP